jgi:hypothetical protein
MQRLIGSSSMGYIFCQWQMAEFGRKVGGEVMSNEERVMRVLILTSSLVPHHFLPLYSFNFRTDGAQFFFNFFVAAINVIDAVNPRFAFGG